MRTKIIIIAGNAPDTKRRILVEWEANGHKFGVASPIICDDTRPDEIAFMLKELGNTILKKYYD